MGLLKNLVHPRTMDSEKEFQFRRAFHSSPLDEGGRSRPPISLRGFNDPRKADHPKTGPDEAKSNVFHVLEKPC
jgi:hypothetical protein